MNYVHQIHVKVVIYICSDIMILYVDDHEDKERVAAIKKEFNCNVVVKRLLVGDILIEQKDYTIAIETKTIQDFIGSCRNNQLRKEAINMKKIYPFSFIIIYDNGKWNKHFTKPLTLNEKYGNIISLMQRYKVPVIQCDNTEHFLKCIKAIIRVVDKNDIPIEQPIVRNKDSNEFVNVLIGIDGVGKKMARTLLDNFKTPGGVLRASDDDLDNIPRLQKKSKESIRRMR